MSRSMNFKFQSLAGLILILAIVACNMPFEQLPPPDEVQTAAAQTLQVILTPSATSRPSTQEVTTTPSPRVTRTAAAVGSATTTVTPTYSVPTLTVREATNCRTGPGEAYEVVFTYLTGKELEIVGRYDPGDFWLVKSNESPTGTCWIWGEFADVTGSYWVVSSVTPPPTATARPPRAPGLENWEFFCSDDTLNFSVIWVDNTNDETGFRIFRNGEVVVELPANSTTFTDRFAVSSNQRVEYYIQVFSPSGTANSSVMPMSC